MIPGVPSIVEGVGYRGGDYDVVSLGDPAAGADLSYSVPAGERWLIHAISAALVTDATVANRVPVLQLRESVGGVYYAVIATTSQTASSTVRYVFAPSVYVDRSGDTIILPLPRVAIVEPGGSIITSTASLQAGDDWGTFWAARERWYV